MITRTQPLIVAARIQAWHIYQQQTGDTRPFAVLWIDGCNPDGTLRYSVRSSIGTGRKARVLYEDGTIAERIIWANARYFEVTA